MTLYMVNLELRLDLWDLCMGPYYDRIWWVFYVAIAHGLQVFGVEISENQGYFYGMELPRVGAFTEKWGSGYRNPVQILG